MLSSSRLSRSLALATLGLGALTAQAGEIYANAGFPGVGLGYAHPLNSHFALRGDFMTLGTHKKDMNEEGIDYKGTLSTSRVALFADYFPFGGVFRLTAGITANNYKLELDASGAGQTINVGGTDYVLSANDGLNVQVKFPKNRASASLSTSGPCSARPRSKPPPGASTPTIPISRPAWTRKWRSCVTVSARSRRCRRSPSASATASDAIAGCQCAGTGTVLACAHAPLPHRARHRLRSRTARSSGAIEPWPVPWSTPAATCPASRPKWPAAA
jgi:hypothetical protein